VEKDLTSAPLVMSPDYRAIYANQIQLSSSTYDIQMVLMRASAPGGRPMNEMAATVFMSPQEAKALSLMLARVVRDFEKKFGDIHLPENVLQNLSGEQPAVEKGA
jgi:hypothetical protein